LLRLAPLYKHRRPALRKHVIVGKMSWPRRLEIVMDDPPWDGGAWLSLGDYPAEYLRGVWTPRDCARFGIQFGSFKGQQIWESLIAVVTCRVRLPAFGHKRIKLEIRSDSEAALGSFVKERWCIPALNSIMSELALDVLLCAFEMGVVYAHIAGEADVWADALSRLSEPGGGCVIPEPLTRVRCRSVQERGESWWLVTVVPWLK
jgi:hypothetical protein